MTKCFAIGSCLLVAVAGRTAELRWDFDSPQDATGPANLSQAKIADGALRGLTRWDPFFYLKLPEGGIDAADYRTLQVRLYSSAPADLLDIYYKTAAGYWCLGGSLPIKAGWGVYTTDLLSNQWRETDNADARKWGGPDGRIITFRIDPGNQSERWVIVDWARLSSEEVPTAYAPDPRIEGAKVAVEAPATVKAGDMVEVRLSVELPPAAKGRTVTAYARLQTATELIATEERRVEATGEPVRVSFSLPTLPFVSAQARIYAGLLEALGPDDTEQARAEVSIVAETPPGNDFPACAIRPLGGSPAVHVNGEPIPFMCFCGMNPLAELDGSRKPRHVEMADAGIGIFSDWFGNSGNGNLGHVSEDEYDYSAFDLYFARMVQQAPRALFLPHVYVTPPTWWQQAHPEERCCFEDGTPWLQSFASERWRREIGDDLTRLIRHLRSQPYAGRIIGLIICSGYTAEWQTWGVWQDQFTDFGEPGLKAWREWLKRRYDSDARLQEAWGQADVSIATAMPASGEARKSATHLMLRDPQAEAQTIDYLTFLNELDAEAILHFARLGKEASGGRLLMGTYYGYLTQHHYHQSESGHCAIEKVLASDDIDFLMSPPTYTERGLGEVSAFMSAVDSVQRHGKIWLSEADYRTYLSDPASGYGRTATAEDSVNVLKREFAHVLCKRAGVSWFDMDAGWLSGAVLPAELGRMQQTMADYLPQRKPYHAEVAAFIDPHSFYYLKPDPALLLHITLEPVLNLYRAGAPFDLYVLSDLNREDLPEYRMYVFLNAYALDQETRAAIERRTQRPAVAALWRWAPGYCFPDEGRAQHAVPLQRPGRMATLEEMGELVGARLRRLDEQQTVRLSAEDAAERYGRRIATLDEQTNPALTLGPLFVPEEGEVLARLEPGGLPALVKAGATFFSVLPDLPPTVLRQVYLDAGVHVYADTDDCVYGDGAWIGVHSKETGVTELRHGNGE